MHVKTDILFLCIYIIVNYLFSLEESPRVFSLRGLDRFHNNIHRTLHLHLPRLQSTTYYLVVSLLQMLADLYNSVSLALPLMPLLLSKCLHNATLHTLLVPCRAHTSLSLNSTQLCSIYFYYGKTGGAAAQTTRLTRFPLLSLSLLFNTHQVQKFLNSTVFSYNNCLYQKLSTSHYYIMRCVKIKRWWYVAMAHRLARSLAPNYTILKAMSGRSEQRLLSPTRRGVDRAAYRSVRFPKEAEGFSLSLSCAKGTLHSKSLIDAYVGPCSHHPSLPSTTTV